MFDRLKGMALILYNNTDFAQAAVRETKGWKIGGNKIKVNNYECGNWKCFFYFSFIACRLLYRYIFTTFFIYVKGGFCQSRESDGILPIYAGIWSRH